MWEIWVNQFLPKASKVAQSPINRPIWSHWWGIWQEELIHHKSSSDSSLSMRDFVPTSFWLFRCQYSDTIITTSGTEPDGQIIFQYFPTDSSNENLPKIIQNLSEKLQFLSKNLMNLKNSTNTWILPKWRNFAKSGHTVHDTLVTR